MYTINGRVACEPFQNTAIETTVKSGVLTIKQKASLTCLTVVFGNANPLAWQQTEKIVIFPGDKVWLRGEAVAHAWAKEVFEVNGKSFILVPIDFIVAKENES